MLDDLKILLGFNPEKRNEELDFKLDLLLDSAKTRLKFLLGGMEPPEELNYIVIEVAIVRFNRIGSEGISSHTVEGESLSFQEDDFAGYRNDIEAFLDAQEQATKGRVRFL